MISSSRAARATELSQAQSEQLTKSLSQDKKIKNRLER